MNEELSPDEVRDRRLSRLHILEGVQLAVDDRVNVVTAIGNSADKASARDALMGQPWNLSEIQAAHVLDAPFSRVTQLGAADLAAEVNELRSELERSI